MAHQKYTGGCDCGRVRFEASFDLAAGSHRCNCTICLKKRWWGVLLKKDDFRFIAGQDQTLDYQPGPVWHNVFCRHCGVHMLCWGILPEEHGGQMWAISIGTLDGLDPETLAKIDIHYLDGLHDVWDRAPKITSYL